MSPRGATAAANEVVIVSGTAERDLGLRDGLVRFLAPWVRKGVFGVWDEGRVEVGEPIALGERVRQADVIVALLSDDLLADERRWALIEAALDRGAHVVPVVGRACGWKATALGDRASLPASGLSVVTLAEAGEAWNEVGEALAKWFEDRGAREGRTAGPKGAGSAEGERAGEQKARPPNNLPPLGLFVGRREELAAVHARLTGGRVAGITQRASVLGLGGVGKTSLALAYAHAHADEYPGGIFWVRAQGDPVSALLAFSGELRAIAPAAVAEVLERLPPNDAKVIAAGVRLALQANPRRSLLVLDNVEMDFREHVPGGLVHVLLTTREPRLAIGGDAGRVRLDVLDAGDARALADGITGGCAADDAAARDRVVLGELGGLAVAVEMAARAVARWTRTWARYEGELRERAGMLLEDPELVGDYGRGAFAAIDLSVRRCAGETARALLESLAALAPGPAPMEWAEAGAGVEAGSLEAARGWEALVEAGLVKVEGAAREAAVHRLVHRRLASTVATTTVDARAAALAVRVVEWLDITVDLGRIPEVQLRVLHVRAVLAALDRTGERRGWIEVANRLAMHLQHRGVYDEARELFQRLLAEAERLDPPDERTVAMQLNNLAMVLRDLGEPAAARPLLERAVDISGGAFGPEHFNVATCLSNLAITVADLGDSAAARRLLERALHISEAALGPAHPDVAVRLSNLASVLQHLGEHAAARPLLERALHISEAALGPEHPSLATTLSNLASALRGLGEPAAARPLLERALHISEAALGPKHPTLATVLSNLASALRGLGEPAAARPLLERALAIDELTFGPRHRNVAVRLSNLAGVLWPLGEHAQARALLERALDIDEHALGTDHPGIALRLSNLAIALWDLGELNAALPLMERALGIAERRLGPDHPRTCSYRENLTRFEQSQRGSAQAEGRPPAARKRTE